MRRCSMDVKRMAEIYIVFTAEKYLSKNSHILVMKRP